MAVVRIVVAGKAIDIEDIPMSVYAEIETATGVGWIELLSAPLQKAAASVMLIEAAAKILGVDCPELNPRTFLASFTVDDGTDSRPEAYEGGLPLPEGDPQTG